MRGELHYVARDCGLYEGHEPGYKTTKEWLEWRRAVTRDWIARSIADGTDEIVALLAKHAAFADFCAELDAA